MQQVPASFYGGMDFKIDTSAYTNFMLKRQAQEAAKEAALDKYYKGLTANATETGMRDQELPAFNAALADYKLFYTENASKIASGNYPELALQAEKLSRVPFEVASQSKNNFARDKTIATIRGANKKDANLWTTGTWDNYTKSTKPQYIPNPSGRGVILNPDYVDFDPMSIETHPEEVDLTKQWKDATADLERKEITIDVPDDIDPKFTVKRSVKTIPTQTGLEAAATKADSQWNDGTEYTFTQKNTIEKFKLNSPEQFNKLLASYQKVFPGKNIETNKDWYIATTIHLADQEELKPTVRLRNDVKWAQWNRSENARVSKELALYNHALNNKPQIQSDNNVKTYFEEINNGTYTTTKGQKVTKVGDRWIDASGKPFTSTGDNTIKIPKGSFPNDFALNAQGKLQGAVDYIDLHVGNGLATGGYNEFTNVVTRRKAVDQRLKASGVKPQVEKVQTVQPVTNDLGF